jgi:arylsulfatase A-like enzyme
MRVVEGEDGAVWPAVGGQCAAAVGDPGDVVDAGRLGRCLSTLVGSWIDRALRPEESPRPNIIVILADDQRADALDATHSPDPSSGLAAMPVVMDRLVDEGVSFTRAYATSPVCGPSRSSFLTGQYAFRTGLVENSMVEAFDDSSTLATWLQDAGYRTGFYGKYLNLYTALWDPETEDPYVPPGWDDFRAFNEGGSIPHYAFSMVENGEIVEYGQDEPAYSTDVMADHALAFLEEASQGEQPFLLYFSTAAPHYPWQPAPRHLDSFDDVSHWSPASYFEEDVSDKPAWVRLQSELTPIRDRNVQFVRRMELAMQLPTDEFVDVLMDRLEELGILDETMIVYTSDNGKAWGEHRWTSKGCAYEECARIPLVVRYPPLAPLPREDDRIVGNVDLAPTLAELAGAPMPIAQDGRSLVRALDDTAREERSEIFLEFVAGSFFGYRSLRGHRWKLVDYWNGYIELYDLENDPFELENLATDLTHASQLFSMFARLGDVRPVQPPR